MENAKTLNLIAQITSVIGAGLFLMMLIALFLFGEKLELIFDENTLTKFFFVVFFLSFLFMFVAVVLRISSIVMTKSAQKSLGMQQQYPAMGNMPMQGVPNGFVQQPMQPMGQPPMQPMGQQPMQPMGQQPMQPIGQQPMQPMGQQPMQPMGQPPMQPMAQPPMQAGEQKQNPPVYK